MYTSLSAFMFIACRYTCLMALCSSRTDDDDRLIWCAESLISAGADVSAFDRQHLSSLMYAAREGINYNAK